MLKELNRKEVSQFCKSFFPQYNVTNDPFECYFGYYDDELIGIIAYSVIYERAEINYICVRDKYRNKKIGSKLMERALLEMQKQKCESVSLEVAVDNEKAINLYKKYDLKKVGIREKYYNGKDALLLMRKLGDENG